MYMLYFWQVTSQDSTGPLRPKCLRHLNDLFSVCLNHMPKHGSIICTHHMYSS